MTNFDEIVSLIKQLDSFKQLIAIKTKIEEDQKYLDSYQDILALQKEVVKLEYYERSQEARAKREEYLAKLDAFKNEVIVLDYLNQIDEFSNFIHELENIINQTI
ncbi:MAG: YlbF family regulator [Candidatus Izemoplasmatales bacterium]